MLSRNQRLSRADVEYVLQKGRKIANSSFTAKFLRSSRTFSRFTVVVSAKIEAKAVNRNRLRRRLYEVFRLEQNLLKNSYDIVLIVKKTLITVKHQELKKMVCEFLTVLNQSI